MATMSLDLDSPPSCLPRLDMEIAPAPVPEAAPAVAANPEHASPTQLPVDSGVPEVGNPDDACILENHGQDSEVAEAQQVTAETDHACQAVNSPVITDVAGGSSVATPAEPLGVALPPEEPASFLATSNWSAGSGDSSDQSAASGTTVKQHHPTVFHRSRSWPRSRSDLSGSVQELAIKHLDRDTHPAVAQAPPAASSASLAEFAHLVRLEAHLSQKHHRLQTRVYRCMVSNALSSRLVRSGALAQRSLVDHFKQDDKRAFTALYNAVHDVRNSCEASRRYAFVEPNLDIRTSGLIETEPDSLPTSFLDQLPPTVKDDLLGFISKIRTDPEFLVCRLLDLSPGELVALASSSQALDPLDSVMSSHHYSRLQGSARRNFPYSPSPLERLLSFQRRDPLSVLLYTIFADSGGPQTGEDRRRTEVWSTTCAKMIAERTAGNEQFMRAVFNAWAALRDWPCKANLELYLMKTLQDGAFILDWAAKRKFETLSLSGAGATQDLTTMERFYDKAIKELFALLVDQPNSCSMPLGIYEIGHAIMRKLSTPERQQAARTLIVCKWFFSSFLLDAMIYPEAHGMMAGYHISASARQRILKEIAVRAQRHVWDVSFDWKPLKPIPPEVRRNIDTILAGMSDSPAFSQQTYSHPARSIPSPPETFEVRPFLVLCPSDITTLVNALFPERRPSSSYTGDSSQQHSLRSTTSSISESPLRGRAGFGASQVVDISSSLSNSGSSVTSETISQDPSVDRFGQRADGMSSHTSVGSRDTLLDTNRPDTIESYGHCLRSHVAQLSTYLGHQATSGTLHPCAEGWAVAYVTPDGTSLEAVMPIDIEEDEEDDVEEAYLEVAGDDVRADAEIGLERDYHELKATVRQLVEEYDIPEEVAQESDSKAFSNRFSTFVPHSMSEQPGILNVNSRSDITPGAQEEHQELQIPTMQHEDPSAAGSTDVNPMLGDSGEDRNQPEQTRSPQLLAMLEAAVHDCKAKLDFATAHYYWEALHRLQALSSSTLARDHYNPLLTYFARGPRNAIRKLASAIEDHDAWLLWLQQAHERRDSVVTDLMTSLHRLRNKMWYATDVRNSAEYEAARNVAVALRYMGETPRSSKIKPSFPFLPRNFAKAPAGTLLLKAETQVLSLLAASPEHGGTAKLSDDQSEMTQQWLRQRNIVNFCKGEERIHRFCLEIDRCINRLIGYDITTAPVLWSSDLFSRDKLILDSGYQQGSLRVTDFGTLVPVGPTGSTIGPRPSIPRSTDWINRPLPQSVRSENYLQSSYDLGYGRTGASRQSSEFVNPYRQFSAGGLSSSVGAPETFWSPFTERRPSSAKQATRTWPRAMVDHNPAAGKGLGGASLEKEDFLRDLKQDLTGLLLSDLGASVWGRGSETDVWFSSEIGEEFLQRLDGSPQRVPAQATTNVSNAEPGYEMSRAATPSSPSNVLPAHSSPNPVSQTRPAEATVDMGRFGTNLDSPANTVPAHARFPYDSAFQRLLQLFSIHPNPFTKLHALHQLALLIALSIDKRPRSDHTNGPREHPPPEPPLIPGQESGAFVPKGNVRNSQARGLRDVIANCEQRRSQPGRRKRLPSPWRRKAAATSTADKLSDVQEIVVRLQRLFRDGQTRPRTLFRDFQFIASFVPGQALDETDSGRAFWNASLAALGLKQDVCRMMVEMADKIVAYHTKSRPGPPNPARVEPSDVGPEVSRFSMADAARMLTIPAKEGDPVAQRELAIFYLTHPDLVARTTFPLSRPREIFKSQMMNQRDEDPARSDPATMCVAYHWMELSSQGGDELARQYLRARAELNALP